MKKLLFLMLSFVAVMNGYAAKKSTLSITVNNKSRSMIVYTPNTMSQNLPLMIITHGMNQSPEYQSVGDGPNYDGGDRLWELTDTAKFICAYLRSDGNTWDTGGTNDIDFVNKTIDELQAKYQINTNRVYWSGFSMGSMLIYHTLAQVNSNAKAENLVKRIACFAPTSGMQFTENPAASLAAKKMKINLIDHHSRQDGVFPINQYDIKSYVTNIATQNGYTKYVSTNNYKSQEGNYNGLREVWTNTSTGNVIELFMYDGGGHWPSWYNRKEIWNFCKRFSLMTQEDEYKYTYERGKTLVEQWESNPDMNERVTFTSLKTAVNKYAPENVDIESSTAVSAAITKINQAITNFEKTISSYKPTGKLDEQPTEFDPNFHIYLCFGQSNMEGNADIETQDRSYVNPRFLMMSAVNMTNMKREKGKWYVAYPPLCRDYTGLTPVDYFGRTMVENLPEEIKVGVINVAVGGASIKLFDEDLKDSEINNAPDWFKNYCKDYDNSPYNRLVECAKEAQKVGVIKGILLHQGCTDNSQKDWPVRVKRVYLRLLKDLGLNEEETPLLAGELLRQSEGGVCWGHNNVIAHLSDAVPNTYVISSEKCPAREDGLHFTAEGYRMIGKRYAETMLTLLDQKKEIDFDTTTEGYFPLTKETFNPSLYLEGTFKKTLNTVTITSTDKGAFGGWRYSKGIDLSNYNYLVVNFARSASCKPTIRIYDTDDCLNPYFEMPLTSGKNFKIDLHDMASSSATAGEKIDPSHIYMIGFTTDGSSPLYLNNIFLSDDGENVTSIEGVDAASFESITDENCFDLVGRRVSKPAHGMYITNGKKVLVK